MLKPDLAFIPWCFLLATCLGTAAFGVCAPGPSQHGDASIVWTKGDLENYLVKWRSRDGVASFVISDYLCQFAASNPSRFLEVMSENTHDFDSWLKEVATLSFVDRGGCIDRSCLRQQILEAMNHLRVDGAEEVLRSKLVAKISSLSVRRVE